MNNLPKRLVVLTTLMAVIFGLVGGFVPSNDLKAAATSNFTFDNLIVHSSVVAKLESCDSHDGTPTYSAKVNNRTGQTAYLNLGTHWEAQANCDRAGGTHVPALITQTAGKTVYAAGERGNIAFKLNLNAVNCGRVQIDVAFFDTAKPINSTERALVFGRVYNTGKNCNGTTPTLTPKLSKIPTSTPTPSLTPTPSPTPVALSCYPSYQTSGTYQWINFYATGGNGSTYVWHAVDGNPSYGTGQSFNTYYTSLGARGVTVHNGNQVAVCAVNVVTILPTPTPVPCYYNGYYICVTPTPTPTPIFSTLLDIHKMGRNISRGNLNYSTTVYSSPGNTIEFEVTLKSLANVNLTNVIVRDALPLDLIYIVNGTSLNGTQIADGIAGNYGINIGTMHPGQTQVLDIWVSVSTQYVFPIGTTTLTNTVYAHADNAAEISSTMTIYVARGSVIGISKVPTGAANSIFLALLVSALTTLTYMGYAQTSTYQKRSLQQLISSQSKDKSKFNFI